MITTAFSIALHKTHKHHNAENTRTPQQGHWWQSWRFVADTQTWEEWTSSYCHWLWCYGFGTAYDISTVMTQR